MDKKDDKRIAYIDLVKFIAICLVCIGHSDVLVDMQVPSIVRDWIYSFHMPLFMLCCGYFSLNSYQKPFKLFLKQKTIQLLVPTVSVIILTILTCYIINSTDDITTLSKLEIIGGMWFLKTLFACYLYVWLFMRLKCNDILKVSISVLLALFFPHGYFLQFNWMLLFFWSGYFLRKYDVFYARYRSIITLLAICIFIVLPIHKEPSVLTYDILFHQPLQLPMQYLMALSGSLALMGCSYYICNIWYQSRIITFFENVGRYTLGIYGLQSFLLQRICVKFIHLSDAIPALIYDFVIIPCIGVVATLICFYLIQILKRNSIINFFMFGNQYK